MVSETKAQVMRPALSSDLKWGSPLKSVRHPSVESTDEKQQLRSLRYNLLASNYKLKRSSDIADSNARTLSEADLIGDSNQIFERKILNIGHKGAEGHVKGNTIESFHRAIDLGVDVIEFDVVACKDGILCHHDAIADSGQWFRNQTIAELRDMLGIHHPTIEEMLCDPKIRESAVHLYFDLKHTEVVHPIMHAILDAVLIGGWSASRMIVATFKPVELLEINAYKNSFSEIADLRTAAIFDAIPITLAKEFESLGCHAISVGKHCVIPELVEDCHRRGLKIWAWTVNRQCIINELIKLGIDGICTDYPERVSTAIANLSINGSECLGFDSSNLETSYHPLVVKLMNGIYGTLSEARHDLVQAITDAKRKISDIEKTGSTELYNDDILTLRNTLKEAENVAKSILYPLVTSERTSQWFDLLKLSSEGKRALTMVINEIASDKDFPLLNLERLLLEGYSSTLP